MFKKVEAMLSVIDKHRQAIQQVTHQLESLLHIDGYRKNQLANVVQTSVDEINRFLQDPNNANPNQAWCLEVQWLYELHHSMEDHWSKIDWEFEE